MEKPYHLKEEINKLLNKLLQELKNYYGERLVSVVLYGSCARGTPRPDSDLDLLIIVEDLPKGRYQRYMEFSKIEEKLEPLLKELEKKGINLSLSPLLRTPLEAKNFIPPYLDMTEDAKILYDKEDFFANILDQLREKLKKLGSKRIKWGGGLLWILKPDLKPGETIEL